jgi:AraC family transcriptional regulator of adaptative response/methylated-DNA-[protein]-cysteine methyltransferase
MSATFPSLSEMDRARRSRDRSYDGVFYMGVRTTGIFCRPSCTARTALARNIEYFPSVKEAVFAGYRACKRCRPLELTDGPPAWVRRLIDRVQKSPQQRITDGHLREMSLSPAAVRRWFSQHYGMTFHAFARGVRLGVAFDRIKRGEKLDNVVLDHGYASHSGFREAFGKILMQSPGRAKEGERVALAWIDSPVGPLIAGAVDAGVCLLEFSDRRALEAQIASLRERVGAAVLPAAHPHLDALRAQLADYFAGTRKDFDLPLVYPGTDFQMRVWDELLRIPYGETRSYEDVARALGDHKAVRAVGTANGLNRIAIVIPCHRVVNKSGQLGGYGGGLWRKQILLDLERGQRQLV